MGTFLVQIELGDPEGRRYETVDALVDTGATYTTVPGSTLRRLGVSPHTRGTFVLADSTRIERDIGRTWLKLEKGAEIVPVIFGDEDSQPLLGAVTLEIFRLGVDPVSQRLIPVPGLLMGELG